MNLWNEFAQKLPRCLTLSQSRIRHAKNRLVEQPLSYWQETFVGMNRLKFLRGDNARGWKATFDWIIANDENHVKVREGKYGPFVIPKPKPVSVPEPVVVDEPLPDEAEALASFTKQIGGV